MKVGRYEEAMSGVEEQEDGAVRLRLIRGGGSFAARFLLRRRNRLGEGTGVENAKGGSAEGDLNSIVDSMIAKKKYL